MESHTKGKRGAPSTPLRSHGETTKKKAHRRLKHPRSLSTLTKARRDRQLRSKCSKKTSTCLDWAPGTCENNEASSSHAHELFPVIVERANEAGNPTRSYYQCKADDECCVWSMTIAGSPPGSIDAGGGRKASGGREAEVRWSGIARQRRQSEPGAATAGRAALLCHAHVQMQEVRGRDVRPCADEATFPPLTCLRGTPKAAKPAKGAAKVLAGRSRQPMDPARVEGRPTDSGYGGSQEASANRPEPEMTEVVSSGTRHEGGSEGGRTAEQEGPLSVPAPGRGGLSSTREAIAVGDKQVRIGPLRSPTLPGLRLWTAPAAHAARYSSMGSTSLPAAEQACLHQSPPLLGEPDGYNEDDGIHPGTGGSAKTLSQPKEKASRFKDLFRRSGEDQ